MNALVPTDPAPVVASPMTGRATCGRRCCDRFAASRALLDVEDLDRTVAIRDEADLDSLDFVRLITAVAEETCVLVPNVTIRSSARSLTSPPTSTLASLRPDAIGHRHRTRRAALLPIGTRAARQFPGGLRTSSRIRRTGAPSPVVEVGGSPRPLSPKQAPSLVRRGPITGCAAARPEGRDQRPDVHRRRASPVGGDRVRTFGPVDRATAERTVVDQDPDWRSDVQDTGRGIGPRRRRRPGPSGRAGARRGAPGARVDLVTVSDPACRALPTPTSSSDAPSGTAGTAIPGRSSTTSMPPSGIVEHAARRPAPLLVMATSAKRPMSSSVFGSVTRDVLRRAGCRSC